MARIGGLAGCRNGRKPCHGGAIIVMWRWSGQATGLEADDALLDINDMTIDEAVARAIQAAEGVRA